MGRSDRISWEALAAGQQLGGAAWAALSARSCRAAQTEALAAEACEQNRSRRSYALEHPLLHDTRRMASRSRWSSSFEAEEPDYVVFPHTYQVRDFAPALAARFGQVLIGDVTAIHDGPVFVRQLHAGQAERRISAHGRGAVLCLGAGGSISRRPGGSRIRLRSRHSRRRSRPRRFATSRASHSAGRRRRWIWARRS